MPPRALRLGTRRSALARAQSGLIAKRLMQLHPGLAVELVGIDTRGDRILDTPLSQVEGKEFFTAEIDAALLTGKVDLTVHSYKDLSLERPAGIYLAAVPPREQPRDIVLFAPDTPQRLRAGATLRIGSSSPRRAAFVPDFLARALPLGGAAVTRGEGAVTAGDVVRLCELRGNVDTRLRRLLEPAASERRLDGVVLALAGLVRLWRDDTGRELLRGLLHDLPRMVLPLSACPTAPAQGALAVECRDADAPTRELLRGLDDPATRTAINAERSLLAQRGGGCHQRFGATRLEVPGLGGLLYLRCADETSIGEPQLLWSPRQPLPPPSSPLMAWDGSAAPRTPSLAIEAGVARCEQRLPLAPALFIAHRRALPAMAAVAINACRHIWVPGIDSWMALAQRGIWIEGCADGLGFSTLQSLLAESVLQLPPLADWTVLTHEGAEASWNAGEVIATYRHTAEAAAVDAAAVAAPPVAASPASATHIYWNSSAQFNRWQEQVPPDAHHACGPGKTYDYLKRRALTNLTVFPSAAHWRQWLSL